VRPDSRPEPGWFRQLIEATNVEHELLFVDASDTLCKALLRDRSKGSPAGTPWITDADFDAMKFYFHPPSDDEKFNVIRHERI